MIAPGNKPPYIWRCCPERPTVLCFRIWMPAEDLWYLALACSEHELNVGLTIEKMKGEGQAFEIDEDNGG